MSFTHLVPGIQEHDIIRGQVFLHELARDLFDLGRNGRGSFKHPSQPSSPPGWAPVRRSQSQLWAAAGCSLCAMPSGLFVTVPAAMRPTSQNTPPQGKAGAHHKTSDLVGAGKEARRVGIYLLVLQPWGRAVGGLPTQGLPEAVCKRRPHQLPTDTRSVSLALLVRCWDGPCLRANNCSQSPPSILKSQGTKEGRGLRDLKVMKRSPERADLAVNTQPGLLLARD